MDKNLILHHSSLERIFKNLISNEHFQLLEQKQIQDPQELLDNVISVLNINKDQAIAKLGNEEKNQTLIENKPISFPSINQKTKSSYRPYFKIAQFPLKMF